MHRKLIQSAFCLAAFAASAAAQTTVTNNNDGTAGAVPVYSGSAALTNSPIKVSGGNVGIGTASPSGVLQVNSAAGSYNLILQDNSTARHFFFSPNSSFGFANPMVQSGDQVLGYSGSGEDTGALDIAPWSASNKGIRINSTGNVGIGTTTPNQKLEVDGSIAITNGSGGSITFQDGTTQTTAFIPANCGADFAEAVDVVGHHWKYGPGDVLVIDPDHAGKFLEANQAYSTMVAGIYSTKPGFVGRLYPVTDKRSAGEVPMAMVGRVPTNVTAKNGPIHVGDLLVSSSTPGYAMKGTDRSRMLGAVIGKALGSLSSGKGVIEVLVTLQ